MPPRHINGSADEEFPPRCRARQRPQSFAHRIIFIRGKRPINLSIYRTHASHRKSRSKRAAAFHAATHTRAAFLRSIIPCGGSVDVSHASSLHGTAPRVGHRSTRAVRRGAIFDAAPRTFPECRRPLQALGFKAADIREADASSAEASPMFISGGVDLSVLRAKMDTISEPACG